MRFPGYGMGGRVAILLLLCAASAVCAEEVHPSIRVSDEVEAQVRSIVIPQMPSGFEFRYCYRVPDSSPMQVVAVTTTPGSPKRLTEMDYELHFDEQAGIWIVDTIETSMY